MRHHIVPALAAVVLLADIRVVHAEPESHANAIQPAIELSVAPTVGFQQTIGIGMGSLVPWPSSAVVVDLGVKVSSRYSIRLRTSWIQHHGVRLGNELSVDLMIGRSVRRGAWRAMVALGAGMRRIDLGPDGDPATGYGVTPLAVGISFDRPLLPGLRGGLYAHTGVTIYADHDDPARAAADDGSGDFSTPPYLAVPAQIGLRVSAAF